MIVANKCLNVCEHVKVIEWNKKKRSPTFPCYPVSRQCPWKKTIIEKKNSEYLSFFRKKRPNSVIIAITEENVDVLKIKSDESFPSTQFSVQGYNCFRSDQNANEGGILVYMRNDCGTWELWD